MMRLVKISAFLWALLFSLPSFAQHQLKEVNVLVRLNQDGSADVTERRIALMGDQGTEGFITFNNMGDIEVKNLAVEDEMDREYEVEEVWDVNRSRAEKTGRCGYNRTDKGVEVCWGIGESGERTYYISYTLTNLVKSYDDYDGFCHSFYEAANSPAEQAEVFITVKGDTLTKEDARVWAFGYEGWKGISKTTVFAKADSLSMRRGDGIIVLLELKKGILNPAVKVNGTFKELVKRPALTDSEYDLTIAMGDSLGGGTAVSSLMGGRLGTGHEERRKRVAEDDGGTSWGLIIGFLIVLGLIAWAAAGKIKTDIANKKFRKKQAEYLMQLLGGQKWDELPYWRELPLKGNLLGSSAILAYILDTQKEIGHPIRGVEFSVQHLYEAFILRMFYKGGISLDYDTDRRGKTRQLFRIKEPVNQEKHPASDVVTSSTKSSYFISSTRRRAVDFQYKGLMHDDGVQYMLQDLLYKAANDDHLLQPDELRSYVNQNQEKLRPLADALYMIAGNSKDGRTILTDEAQQVMGFVRYLKDFSLVEERHLEEVNLWKEYLVFASFYGIADQVRKDMKKVAPDTLKLDQLIPPHQVIEDFRPITTALASSLYTAHMYETKAEREARRSYSSSSSSSSARSYSSSSGSSGRSSRSGGGGHSGGGGSGFR